MLKLVLSLPNNDRYKQVSLQELIKREWESVNSKELAEKKLRLTNFQSLARKRGLIGMVYQMSATSYKESSLSYGLMEIFSGLIGQLRLSKYLKADVISIKDKKLGYERQKTIRIMLRDKPSETLNYSKTVCYISANVKNYKSFERTWEVVSFDMSRGDVPLTTFFEEAGILEEVLKIYE